jgi:alanine racemase
MSQSPASPPSAPLKAPLRVRLDRDALVSNWRWLAAKSGSAACGAAIKANGYGVGARAVLDRLAAAGCRDFFVATWAEAIALGALPDSVTLSVLHGVRDDDMATALGHPARPVLNTAEQAARWKTAQGGACDVMVDTGMNRLGLSASEVESGLLDDMQIATLMSHLASADENVAQNHQQRDAFLALRDRLPAERYSLANSAGICLGADYGFDLTRPGIALYGGIPREEASGHIRQVAFPEAQILQRRTIQPGDAIGYNATFTADRAMDVAILNLGYADGYLRGFSGGKGSAGGGRFPVIGRVSMDLTAICVDADPALREGDWVEMDYHLPTASAASGLSQYELLTGLGQRYDRIWS